MYAHIESALVRGGFIPRASVHVTKAYHEFANRDSEDHHREAMLLLDDVVQSSKNSTIRSHQVKVTAA